MFYPLINENVEEQIDIKLHVNCASFHNTQKIKLKKSNIFKRNVVKLFELSAVSVTTMSDTQLEPIYLE
jgi:hypothetical protein